MRSRSPLDGEIQRVMRSLDPAMPLFGVRPVEEMLGFVRIPMRIAATAFSALGLLSVVLAATGIFGLVAYAVSRRRREIAIRVAVGASQASILQLVLRRMGQ